VRYLPLLLFLASCAAEPPPEKPLRDVAALEEAIGRASGWLSRQQRADGSWASGTYGFLKSGQSMTPFVGRAMRLGDRPVETERALKWIRAHVGADGSLGNAGETADYPTYATALALDLDATLPGARRYLASCQVTKEGHPERGGFAFGAKAAELADAPHTAEISRTAWAAEALGAFPGAPAAIEFVARCQAADGGFYFTPAADGNKAGAGTSYGSATCDGIRALRRLGVSSDDERVKRGLAWLDAHESYGLNPGFSGEGRHWETGIYFYYLAALAGVRADLGGPEGWKERLAGELLKRQRSDGSFVNSDTTMREDDPLIATALALEALVRCR
jgi:hypothetical protein